MNNRLKVIRAERNLSQAQLATMAGISRGALCALERGETDPDCSTALKIVKALNLPMEDIFCDFRVRQA